VGDEAQWLEGKIILFDTSIYHESINDSDKMRSYIEASLVATHNIHNKHSSTITTGQLEKVGRRINL
jgi:hypothetical protein